MPDATPLAGTAEAPALKPRDAAVGYAGLVLGIGLVLGFAARQHYDGPHAWEPFLWEMSSAVCTGGLALAVYRWHRQALCVTTLPQRLLRHALGAVAYVSLHTATTFALRLAVYAAVGVAYHPGSVGDIVAYESGKDLAAYLTLVGICHGIVLYLDAQQRQRDLARLRAELAEAQLARLADQVQPHFLFNTLNLISSVMYEDVARADRILNELAELLRQTLAAQQAATHRLGEELQLVTPFLSIMQARFGARLRCSIDADEAARACRVPTLLLITPVENAIKHGVAASTEAVEVRVQARVTRGRLHVRVENTGPAPLRGEREGAFGLPALRQRLAAAHGEQSSVVLEALPAGGCCLSITLPAATA